MNNNKRAIYLRKLDDEILNVIEKHKDQKKIKTKTECVIDIIQKHPQLQIKLEKQNSKIRELEQQLIIANEHFKNLESLIQYLKTK